MRILADAFGGDNAPSEILKGCAAARRAYGYDITLVGDEQKIRACAAHDGTDISGMDILHADGVFSMETQPTALLKEGKDTSMAVGLRALADGAGDAFVSAGSTGALLVGATFLVKRIKGVKRPALGAVMPSATTPFILVDTGANAECTVPMLCSFAKLGDIYMRELLGVENPRVGLANIGAEATKGTKLQVEAYQALSELPDIHFTGNVEVRDIPFGAADVVVADGFTGNVILKMYEGVAKMMSNEIKAMFKKNPLTMLSYLGVKSGMDGFRKKLDYKQYGGAPILGVQKPVIKAHGSSDAYAFQSALRQAADCVNGDVTGKVKEALQREPQSESVGE